MRSTALTLAAAAALSLACLSGCSGSTPSGSGSPAPNTPALSVTDRPETESPAYQEAQRKKAEEAAAKKKAEEEAARKAKEQAEAEAKIDVSNLGDKNPADEAGVRRALAGLDFTQDFQKDLVQGEKPSEFQKYIVLHDTECIASPAAIYDMWNSDGNHIGAHFVIGTDGKVMQGIPLEKICHHAGFGDTGHNKLYGTTDESRDAKKGTQEIGSWAADYGMNSYSIGIEIVHQGQKKGYPKKQLQALDQVIAYIDAYFGTQSKIIDHKAWRSGNSDTSKAFAKYLKSYQDHRSYK
ncbi:MAG: peptidoglycan recognition family protein [Coriobacteriia bacterium]|nr:peptidoglycan recognition family protein [Coriobacteriia bacterium]